VGAGKPSRLLGLLLLNEQGLEKLGHFVITTHFDDSIDQIDPAS
jgi:hypothetical protein